MVRGVEMMDQIILVLGPEEVAELVEQMFPVELTTGPMGLQED